MLSNDFSFPPEATVNGKFVCTSRYSIPPLPCFNAISYSKCVATSLCISVLNYATLSEKFTDEPDDSVEFSLYIKIHWRFTEIRATEKNCGIVSTLIKLYYDVPSRLFIQLNIYITGFGVALNNTVCVLD